MDKFKVLYKRLENLLDTYKYDKKITTAIISVKSYVAIQEKYYNLIPNNIRTTNTLQKIIIDLSHKIDQITNTQQPILNPNYKEYTSNDASTDANTITLAYITDSINKEVAKLEAARQAEVETVRLETARLAEVETARQAEVETARLETARLAEVETARLAEVETARLAEVETARLAEVETARLAEVETARLAKVETARFETARLAEVETAKLAEVETAKLAEVETARLAEVETARLAEVEAARLAEVETARLAEVETARLAEVETARQIAEASRLETKRLKTEQQEAERLETERQETNVEELLKSEKKIIDVEAKRSVTTYNNIISNYYREYADLNNNIKNGARRKKIKEVTFTLQVLKNNVEKFKEKLEFLKDTLNVTYTLDRTNDLLSKINYLLTLIQNNKIIVLGGAANDENNESYCNIM